MARIGRFMRRLLAVYTILVAALICWQCADIYRDAYSPEKLSDRGVPLERVYTPEKVSVRLNGMLAFSAAYPVVLAGVLLTRRFDDSPRQRVYASAEYRLAQLKRRIEALPLGAVREERRRMGGRIVSGAVIAGCGAFCLMYLLDRRNFASWDLETVMGNMLGHMAPYLLLAFAAACVFSEFSRRSTLREMDALKDEIRTERIPPKTKRAQTRGSAVRCGILAIAIIFIVLGVMNGDPRSVLTKAIRICTECIGLG